MTFILSIHPVAQLVAILFVLYAAYLGFQRTQSLHFGKTARFLRERHVIAGSIALISMLEALLRGSLWSTATCSTLTWPCMLQLP